MKLANVGLTLFGIAATTAGVAGIACQWAGYSAIRSMEHTIETIDRVEKRWADESAKNQAARKLADEINEITSEAKSL